ncbi:MAG TPA: hypothetical protein VES20_17660 [Bryobacteraceae bacterium]|nr:hypothetical protein [Bryobacteraceae bacterium]
MEQFMKTTSMRGIAFSHDEKQVHFSSNESGIFNVHAVPTTGGKPVALTSSKKESVFSVDAFPSDPRFLFESDQGGNELNHIYVRDPGGKDIDLTPGEKGKADYKGFHPNGKWFYFTWNNRDPKFFDLYKLHTATLEREKLFENTVGLEPENISRDERWIALLKPNATNDSDIYLFDTKTKQTKNITAHTGNIENAGAEFDPSSRYLYYLSNDGHEFLYVARYELSTGKKDIVDKADWDIVFCTFSQNGKYRVIGKNVDARTQVTIYDHATGKPVKLPPVPEGEIRTPTFSHSESKLAFYVNADRLPSALYVYDFSTGKLLKVADGANPEIAAEDLVETQVVRFKSFDGLTIPGISTNRTEPQRRAAFPLSWMSTAVQADRAARATALCTSTSPTRAMSSCV